MTLYYQHFNDLAIFAPLNKLCTNARKIVTAFIINVKFHGAQC